jgi:predicted  nucleic acid-binding Zn-ribbon protein
MDTKFTGIINPGDTQEIREWIETRIGSVSDRNTEMADLKTEMALLRQTVDIMHKKIDTIERILEKVSD